MTIAMASPKGEHSKKRRQRRTTMDVHGAKGWIRARIPDRLYAALWAEAERDQRSLAAELRFIITDFLRRRSEARRTESALMR